jgi:hypothetical protein
LIRATVVQLYCTRSAVLWAFRRTNRRFKFYKRGQQFIRLHNETLSVLQAMAHGSAAAWGHLNLLGEYDFSEDKLQDSVGIKLPKLTD